MNSVYCLFKAAEDGDSYVSWDLINVSTSVDTLKDIARAANDQSARRLIGIDPRLMTADNDYIHVGRRKDAARMSPEASGPFVGYIIEEIPLV